MCVCVCLKIFIYLAALGLNLVAAHKIFDLLTRHAESLVAAFEILIVAWEILVPQKGIKSVAPMLEVGRVSTT